MLPQLHTIRELENRGYRVQPGTADFFLLWAGPFASLLSQYLTCDHSRLDGSIRVPVDSPALLQKIDDFQRTHALLFDLDDTLVDTSKSYDAAVEQLTGCSHQDLQNLRAEGGFNDDWTAAHELLKRAGKPQPLERVIAEGKQIYARLAPTAEIPYFKNEWLNHWRKRHRTFIFTGRPRDEYESIWGERLQPYFHDVLCLGEHGLPGKPSPDGLHHLMQKHKIAGGIYVGNSVDDMRAAKMAGLFAIGVTTNQSAATLAQAGADLVLPNLEALHISLS
ncbi:MAG: HAD family hydrolase [Candidatus Eremiobacteraeota bacterium]|nr:HAD family hydrolase [Candidatus Eremiobacteraeota bacterium]MCW5867527.1 HAD family hydrolase [Candidatus Eremiobacteraeota bacterium]